MTVHLQIAEQVRKHREAQKEFLALDAMRERAIEFTLEKAKAGEDFQTEEINRVTEQMNQIALQFQFPTRKLVTREMISTYLQK